MKRLFLFLVICLGVWAQQPIVGPAASGSANVGAPVKSGGAYNSLPPTVADGQVVDLQTTKNGAMVVATGVDPFLVQDPTVINMLWSILRAVRAGQPIMGPLGTTARVDNGSLAMHEDIPAQTWDPCSGPNKWNVPVSTSSNVQLVAGTAGRSIHICGGVLIVTTAGSFSLVEGTGTVCATGIAAVVGSTTAANGPALAANAGFLLGNGLGTFTQANGQGNNLCILLTGTGLIAGNLVVAY